MSQKITGNILAEKYEEKKVKFKWAPRRLSARACTGTEYDTWYYACMSWSDRKEQAVFADIFPALFCWFRTEVFLCVASLVYDGDLIVCAHCILFKIPCISFCLTKQKQKTFRPKQMRKKGKIKMSSKRSLGYKSGVNHLQRNSEKITKTWAGNSGFWVAHHNVFWLLYCGHAHAICVDRQPVSRWRVYRSFRLASTNVHIERMIVCDAFALKRAFSKNISTQYFRYISASRQENKMTAYG